MKLSIPIGGILLIALVLAACTSAPEPTRTPTDAPTPTGHGLSSRHPAPDTYTCSIAESHSDPYPYPYARSDSHPWANGFSQAAGHVRTVSSTYRDPHTDASAHRGPYPAASRRDLWSAMLRRGTRSLYGLSSRSRPYRLHQTPGVDLNVPHNADGPCLLSSPEPGHIPSAERCQSDRGWVHRQHRDHEWAPQTRPSRPTRQCGGLSRHYFPFLYFPHDLHPHERARSGDPGGDWGVWTGVSLGPV